MQTAQGEHPWAHTALEAFTTGDEQTIPPSECVRRSAAEPDISGTIDHHSRERSDTELGAVLKLADLIRSCGVSLDIRHVSHECIYNTCIRVKHWSSKNSQAKDEHGRAVSGIYEWTALDCQQRLKVLQNLPQKFGSIFKPENVLQFGALWKVGTTTCTCVCCATVYMPMYALHVHACMLVPTCRYMYIALIVHMHTTVLTFCIGLCDTLHHHLMHIPLCWWGPWEGEQTCGAVLKSLHIY